ncbi:coiled-coil domain-containing protein 34 [Monomorium pharaonis]|uniref:coiled-coil domain-containing protein 34 n=1 Tax=Monomorium pharaonis TaxID=307658 RepID=UPI0017470540|nr:coiled-coil domain-containing protein 34 [Monomorium pharaonis]
MINDSGIDSWKTGSNSNGFARNEFGLVDHRANSDEDAIVTRVKNSSSGSEIRYINPAIYTESFNEERLESNYKQEGFITSLSEFLSQYFTISFFFAECHNRNAIDANRCNSNASAINLPIIVTDTTSVNHVDKHSGQSTYRCYSSSFPDATLPSVSLEPSTARSAVSSAGTARVERRCKIDSDQNEMNADQNETIKRDKCVLDSRQVMRISTTSLSVESSIGDHQTSNGSSDLGRRIAYAEWMRKKHEAAQRAREKEERAARKRQEEEEREAREKEERARLEKENFVKWIERKRQQELNRKAMLENELELQRRLKEIEDNLAGAKTTYLRRWFHKKKEEQKARHKEQEMRQKKMDEERERRLEQSTKAYEKWRENSKNRPKPATQGLLPHQKAKPAYVNPIPWQSIVENDSDEVQEDTFDEKKRNVNQLKLSNRKTIMTHQ